ncbi:MAG: glycosyltransferase family 2 protein [Candidatus Vogelbacteria bacterium]|nr:glycosyltransferase family 2 protein [Candidatus Vogelbacteria bacterium]
MIKRTIPDKVISGFNAIRYKVIEPILLAYYRLKHLNSYEDKKDSPLISITIPTYDRGKLLVDRTLPSIFSQTYQNFEIIIVGDCCPGDTPEILSRVKDPRVKFINLPKRTKYPADPTLRWFISGVDPSNHALEIAQGKWISYFDDDDIMAPDYLESLLRFAQEGNYEFVAGLYEEERDGVRSVRGQRTNAEPEFGGHSTWLYRAYLRFFKYNINSWRKSYNCPQDIDLQLRMMSAGVQMEGLNKIVSYVRPRPGLKTVGLAARLVGE